MLLISNGPSYYHSDYKKSDLLRRRWRFVQHLANQFWKKWMKMYLPELQRRQKWLKEHKNLKVGDLVLLTEENTPRFLWPMGMVKEVKLGRDGLVRVVKIQTNTTTLIRPISKVILLECWMLQDIQQKRGLLTPLSIRIKNRSKSSYKFIALERKPKVWSLTYRLKRLNCSGLTKTDLPVIFRPCLIHNSV